MTPRQHECLIFIQRYSADHGVSPTYAEITASMGYKSRSQSQTHVRALIGLGHLAIRAPHASRSIVVIKPTLDGKFFFFDNRTKNLVPVARLAA